jgi:hypothetical protein
MVATGAWDSTVGETPPAAGGCAACLELAAFPEPSQSSHVDLRHPSTARRPEDVLPPCRRLHAAGGRACAAPVPGRPDLARVVPRPCPASRILPAQCRTRAGSAGARFRPAARLGGGGAPPRRCLRCPHLPSSSTSRRRTWRRDRGPPEHDLCSPHKPPCTRPEVEVLRAVADPPDLGGRRRTGA